MRYFYKHFSFIMSSDFWYQTFVTVSRYLGEKFPVVDDLLSSHEQRNYPATSFDENCKEFEFETDKSSHVDLRQTYLALKLKFVEGRGYETYITKEGKRSTGKSQKKLEKQGKHKKMKRRRRFISSRYLGKQPFAINFSPMLKCTSTISKTTTLINCMCTSLTIPTTSREPFLTEYKDVLHFEGLDYEECPD